MGKTKENLDDLLGDSPAKGGKGGKAAAGKGGKAPAAAKGGKAAKAKTNGSRSPKGEGKFYFDPKAREQLAAKIGSSIKTPISTKDIAAKLKTETWKVRLACTDLVAAKKAKMVKTGNVFTVSAK